jgi:hypothetical protein
MNHDELRSTIQHYNWVEATDLIKALDTVVELHKPDESDFPDEWESCVECSGNGYVAMYPCPTIQAIEKELK